MFPFEMLLETPSVNWCTPCKSRLQLDVWNQQVKQLSSECGAVYKQAPPSAHSVTLAFLLAPAAPPPLLCFQGLPTLLLPHDSAISALPSFQFIGENETQAYPMATGRKLSQMFVVAVLVSTICFADVAQGIVQGRTVRATKLQEQAGIGDFIYSKLPAKALLNVECRLQSSVVAQDPWWLKVVVTFPGVASGYVPDFDVACGNASPASHCDIVPHC